MDILVRTLFIGLMKRILVQDSTGNTLHLGYEEDFRWIFLLEHSSSHL